MVLKFETVHADQKMKVIIINGLYFIPFEDIYSIVHFRSNVRLSTYNGTFLLECKDGQQRDYIYSFIHKTLIHHFK